MSDLERVMRDVARAVQGDARRRQLLPEVQSRLEALDEQSRQSQRSYGGWRLSLLGAAACAAGIAIFVLRPHPISYAVDGAGAGRSGAVGERLVAPDAAPLALRFSDGSQVMMPPHAQAHVDALDAQGATVALEGGTVEVSVVHRAHTRWEIRAGRYHVRVTGTRFAAGWDARSQSLTVTMHEGSVEVTGPGLKAPARVVTGQRLRTSGAAAETPAADEPEVVVEDANTVTARQEMPTPAVAPAADPIAEVAQPTAAPERTVPAARGITERRGGTRVRQQHVAPAPFKLAMADAEWRGLEARGKRRDALAAALRDADWNESCQRLGAEDLIKLGDLARTGGRPDLADAAYQSTRRRFPQADRAIYGLGKLAFDQRNDYKAAANLFELYVKRFPEGPLAHEAVSLWLESREKAGDNAGARAAAASYLEIFPKGPKASQARALVGN
jgi:hypothetical protein